MLLLGHKAVRHEVPLHPPLDARPRGVNSGVLEPPRAVAGPVVRRLWRQRGRKLGAFLAVPLMLGVGVTARRGEEELALVELEIVTGATTARGPTGGEFDVCWVRWEVEEGRLGLGVWALLGMVEAAPAGACRCCRVRARLCCAANRRAAAGAGDGGRVGAWVRG